MGILQKNPFSTENTKPLYTLGLNKTVIIVGLGNLGKNYEKSRHNIGFVCIDAFAKTHGFDGWIEKKDFKCLLAAKTLGDAKVLLIKPTTMMNLSGEALNAVARFYKIESSKTVAVYDEIDVPFGQIRTRVGGGTAGHNGVKSLVSHIGSEFGRVRIGIQSDKESSIDTADYVLADFNKNEVKQIPALTREVTSILTEYLYRGELQPETRSFLV